MSREKTDDDVECEYCGLFFTKDAYEIHKERNRMLWTMASFKKIKCNHFIRENKRFSSFDAMRDSAIK